MKVKDLPLRLIERLRDELDYDVEFLKISYRLKAGREIHLGELTYKAKGGDTRCEDEIA